MLSPTPVALRSPWRRRGLLSLLALGLLACAASPRPAMMAPGAMEPAGAAPAAQAMPMEAMAPPPGFNNPRPEPVMPAPVADDDRKQRRPKDEPGPVEMVWAPVREFPLPSYEQPYEGPRVDFRETVFWRPSVQTGEGGEAQVQFYLSDAVTTFRATAEGLGGGQAGRGDAVIASKLPVALSARLPLEVSSGDVIELPVTVTNATRKARQARIATRFGPAFALAGAAPADAVSLQPGEGRSVFVPLRVTGDGREAAAGAIELAVDSGGLRDALSRTVRVVPRGFPAQQSASGKLRGGARQSFDLPKVVAGSLEAAVELFPSPTATLVAGADAMLREPSGCFEQTSSSNYPNVMVLSYVASQPRPDPAVTTRATQLLARGYQKLTGYESKSHGFEWFGADPGHEALTAYGVVQFTDMAKVFPDVDRAMIKRTVEWLKGRRDGKGGYKRNDRALDSFGRAGEETTAVYITHALVEAGEGQGLDREIDATRALARSTRDPYLLALAADTLALRDARAADAGEALGRLAALQSKDGHFPGARESITRSGGAALDMETTALAALALLRAPAQAQAAGRALDWITAHRQNGGFGSTQATILALKALTRAAEGSAVAEGTVSVSVNGAPPVELKLEGASKPRLAGLESLFHEGKNTVEVRGPDGLSYGVSLRYHVEQPAPSPQAQVALAVDSPTSAKVGAPVTVTATLTSKSATALPMTIARIGLPGGLTSQTWQLDELRARKVIDFYETREREVIVYFRALPPRARVKIPLQLIAAVPGQFTAPASQAYLYYTDEHRSVVAPAPFTVTR